MKDSKQIYSELLMMLLESDNADLIGRNYDLNAENDKLKERLGMISKVVNDTWC